MRQGLPPYVGLNQPERTIGCIQVLPVPVWPVNPVARAALHSGQNAHNIFFCPLVPMISLHSRCITRRDPQLRVKRLSRNFLSWWKPSRRSTLGSRHRRCSLKQWTDDVLAEVALFSQLLTSGSRSSHGHACPHRPLRPGVAGLVVKSLRRAPRHVAVSVDRHKEIPTPGVQAQYPVVAVQLQLFTVVRWVLGLLKASSSAPAPAAAALQVASWPSSLGC